MHKLKVIILSLLSLMAMSVPSEAITVDRVLATVNNEPITLSDYKRFISQSAIPASTETVDENVLKKLIDGKIILIEAKKSGIDTTEPEILGILKEFQESNNFSDEELKKRLAEEGMALNDYINYLKERMISLKFIDRELNSKIMVSDNEIDEYYTQNIEKFIDKPERKRIKAIFMKLNTNAVVSEITDLKSKSLKIISDIQRGKPFDEMCNLYSSEPLKSQECMLGEFEKGALIPELDMAIASLPEGEVSAPVWTKQGVYILKMIAHIKESYVPLSQARAQIYTTLYQQEREFVFNELVKSLWDNSSVSIKK